MKIFCNNTVQGLVPLYDSDMDEKRKLKLNVDYECVIREARNLQFHKKCFALINLGCDNSPRDMPLDAYRAYVTMKAGWVDVYKTEKGVMALPKSIAFDKMDDKEFAELYRAVIGVIVEDMGATKEDIESNLINFL